MDITGQIKCVNCGKELSGEGGEFGPNGTFQWRDCDCNLRYLLYRLPAGKELLIKTQSKSFKEDNARSISDFKSCFQIAHIPVHEFYILRNEFITKGMDMVLAHTDWGMIKLGWRRQAVYMNWESTKIQYEPEPKKMRPGTACIDSKYIVYAATLGELVTHMINLKNKGRLYVNKNNESEET